MSRLARRSLFLVSSILITLVIGTVGFIVIAGYSPFDAFYMTLTTMTTVGYGEIHPLGHAAERQIPSRVCEAVPRAEQESLHSVLIRTFSL